MRSVTVTLFPARADRSPRRRRDELFQGGEPRSFTTGTPAWSCAAGRSSRPRGGCTCPPARGHGRGAPPRPRARPRVVTRPPSRDRQVLCREKLNAAVTPSEPPAALVRRPVSLTGVLDDGETVAGRRLRDRVHIDCLPVQVHRHDRGGARRDRRSHGGGVHESAALEAIDEHRRGADVAHGLRRGDEGVDRDDDIVADALGREQRELSASVPSSPRRRGRSAKAAKELLEGAAAPAPVVGGPLDHEWKPASS